MSTDQILINQNQEEVIRIEGRPEEESRWLTQAQMGTLFNKDKRTISVSIFKEGELDESSVVRKFRTTAIVGKFYDANHFNLG